MEDLNGIRVFVAVAEAGGFTAAAGRLGLTASGVSKAIARLEHEYGVRLLHRTTRKVGLTADGQEFYERCRQIVGDLEEAEHQLTRGVSAPRGRLRVHLPSAFGKRVVLPRMRAMLERLPELRIDVELGERAVDITEEGFDAAVRFGEPTDPGLVARRLCGMRFVACASPRYLRRHGVPAEPKDLSRHACLGYATSWRGHYREWPLVVDGSPVMHSVSGRLNVNNAEALLEAAIEGAGIAMVASFVAYDAVRDGRLRVVLKDFVAPETGVHVIHPPGVHRSPRVRWLLDMLAQAVPQPAPWDDITAL